MSLSLVGFLPINFEVKNGSPLQVKSNANGRRFTERKSFPVAKIGEPATVS
jgi:hypothetical protein